MPTTPLALPMLLLALLALAAVGRAQPNVLIIGIDGLGGDWLMDADAPNLKMLIANGTSTLVMQDVIGTSSSQNWMSMIAGAGPDQHGVYTNAWEIGDSVPTPTIFAVWREQRPTAKIGALYHWGGFGRLVEDGVCDVKTSPGDQFATTAATVDFIVRERPNLTFIHLDNVDAGGHGSGWGSADYFAAITVADQLVGDLLQALRDADMYNNTVIAISSDHGGTRFGGHGADRSPLRNIPFIVWGAGIRAGVQVEREVRVFDLAATVAEAAGLERPAIWIATPVYEAFADFAAPVAAVGNLDVVMTTEYESVYDTTGENSNVLGTHSIWRPVALPGYVSLGDVAVRGYDAPTVASPLVRDVPEQLVPPLAYERIWTNTEFLSYTRPVTLWQPIPPYGYTCVGSLAVPDLPSAAEPDRARFRCVHSSLAVRAPTAELIVRNAGFSRLEYGWWVSLWRPAGSNGTTDAVVDVNSFIVRRDPDGPGYNKFYYLDAARVHARAA